MWSNFFGTPATPLPVLAERVPENNLAAGLDTDLNTVTEVATSTELTLLTDDKGPTLVLGAEAETVQKLTQS